MFRIAKLSTRVGYEGGYPFTNQLTCVDQCYIYIYENVLTTNYIFAASKTLSRQHGKATCEVLCGTSLYLSLLCMYVYIFIYIYIYGILSWVLGAGARVH